MKNFYLRVITSFVLGAFAITSVIYGKILFNLFVFSILILGLIEILKIKKNLIKIIILFLLIFFLISLYNLRLTNNGLFLLFWCFTITWSTDISAYILGKLFGTKKINFISPNKTYFGFISGLIFSQTSYFIAELLFKNNLNLNLQNIFFIQLCSAILVIFGDLLFSYLKRVLKIKDYSNILPGHGGIFDRIDGLIFAVIFFNFIFYL